MQRIIYSSRAALTAKPVSLLMREIEIQSAENNSRDAITGFLVCDGHSFFQVLEGNSYSLGRTFERIRSDPRHCDLRIISKHPVSWQEFPGWSMKSWLCTPENVQIFMRHGFDNSFDRTISAEQLLALGRELHSGSGSSTAITKRDFCAKLKMYPGTSRA